MTTGIRTVYGCAGAIGQADYFDKVLDVLEKHSVKILDTAQFYTDSEKILGEHNAHQRFIIDTKLASGLKPGTATRDGVLSSAQQQLSALGTKQVDIYYLHAPDHNVPFEETLESINKLYQEGAFKRFGLSNFYAEDVQKVYDICEKNGWVKPTAYQGNYNAVARKQESVLFPTLRKLGICFYAYSPLAGGFLTKTAEDIKAGKGRFNEGTPIGKMYSGLYNRPSYIEALKEWESIAKETGCSRAELGYRWVKYNSPLKAEYGDGIIVGASSLEQLEQTLKGLEAGPLPDSALKGIDEVWEKIKHEAPLDNING